MQNNDLLDNLINALTDDFQTDPKYFSYQD